MGGGVESKFSVQLRPKLNNCVVHGYSEKKSFWVQRKFLGPKILWVPKNILSQQFLVPHLPYGIGLSKVGWIGRGGVGMGVPFLGFNVAYIPNLSLLQSLEPFEKGSKI